VFQHPCCTVLSVVTSSHLYYKQYIPPFSSTTHRTLLPPALRPLYLLLCNAVSFTLFPCVLCAMSSSLLHDCPPFQMQFLKLYHSFSSSICCTICSILLPAVWSGHIVLQKLNKQCVIRSTMYREQRSTVIIV
jgi:hypothetical protein